MRVECATFPSKRPGCAYSRCNAFVPWYRTCGRNTTLPLCDRSAEPSDALSRNEPCRSDTKSFAAATARFDMRSAPATRSHATCRRSSPAARCAVQSFTRGPASTG